MRKTLLASGILLLFIGIILASSSNMPIETYRSETEMASISKEEMQGKEWQVSAFFGEGAIMTVEVEPRTGEDGWWIIFVRADSRPMPLYVTIAGPSGGKTMFKVFFWAGPESVWGTSQSSTGEVPVEVYNYTLVQRSDDLEVRFQSGVPEEVIKKSGNFTARVEPYAEPGPYNPTNATWPSRPPDSITIYDKIYDVEYPYMILLPTGVVLGVCGVSMAVLGSRNKRKRRFKRV